MIPLKIQLPYTFFNEETKCNFTITSEMKRVWAVELDLLVEFDRVCKKIGATYFLYAGTLLGAIRHKGFIPWDDDIDVIMLREDYNKLLASGNTLFDEPYFLQNAYTDKGYFHGHSQLRNSATCGMLLPYEGKRALFNQGIFIDIFVLDGVTEDKTKLAKQLNEENKLRKLYFYMYQPFSNNKIYEIAKKARARLVALKYGDLSKLYSRLEDIAQRYSSSRYIDVIEYRSDVEKVKYFKKEWYSDTELVEFEGFKFPAPRRYSEVLNEYFGPDYMNPKHLPTEHGTTMHFLFDTDRSYVEVLKELKQ